MKFIVKYLTNSAKISSYELDDKYGLNLYADSDYLIKQSSKEFISTGIALTWIKYDELCEEPSIVYFEYCGEIKIMLFNYSDKDIVITKGEKIAQAKLTRINRFIKK